MSIGPLFIVRSYGGGAQVAQLVEEMGADDLSFTISPTTGWVEEDGSALGTAGPFTVVIDRFTATVEKILCSSVNLTTGLVEVYVNGSFNGRGYDGTTQQAHVPGGSTSGVQTCWSSIEAYEANQAVSYVLGTAGGTPSTGQTLKWGASAPVWGTPTPLGGNPSGKAWCTSGSSVASPTTATLQASGLLKGSMTFTSGTGTGLVAPVAGNYLVSGQIKFNNSGAVSFSVEAGIMLNNTSLQIRGNQSPLTTNQFVGSVVSGLVSCAANDVINLWYETNSTSGIAFEIDSPGQDCYLCAALMSS